MTESARSSQPPGRVSGLDPSHGVEEVCRLTGLEPGQVRFLEAEFGVYFGDGAVSPRRVFRSGQVALFSRLRRYLFEDGKTTQDAHRILKQSAGAEAGVGGAPARIWAVTSGKGGVGKTTLSIQLALAAARRGLRPLVIDADLGLGNVRVQCGLPGGCSLAEVLMGSAGLAEAVQPGPGGIRVVGNASGEARIADLSPTHVRALAPALRRPELEADVILLDTGAGIAGQVLSFLHLADEVLVVTTPDVSAMLDAYGVMKAARRAGVSAPFHVLVNLVESGDDAEEVYARIRVCAERYLNGSPAYLGALPRDPALSRAGRDRRPNDAWTPDHPLASRLLQLAAALCPATAPTCSAPQNSEAEPNPSRTPKPM